jgi:hypothetical protein
MLFGELIARGDAWARAMAESLIFANTFGQAPITAKLT